MYQEINPEWYIFSRLFIRRHNHFIFYTYKGFSAVLEKYDIEYTIRGRWLYFSCDIIVTEMIKLRDYEFISKYQTRILRLLLDVSTGINIHYLNKLSEEELRLLSIVLNYRLNHLFITSSDPGI